MLEGPPVAAADLEHAPAQPGEEQQRRELPGARVRAPGLPFLEQAREAGLLRAVERHGDALYRRGHGRLRPAKRMTDVVTDTGVLAGLEPSGLWRHFELLTRLARPSQHEGPVIEHVRAWAASTDSTPPGLRPEPRRARAGEPGRESAPVVVLQGHLDMVCERRARERERSGRGQDRAVRQGDWLTADGTTLGADNGVGIAAMMALAEDDAPHGPLELLMTVVEEVGVAGEGANGLDPSLVSGSILQPGQRGGRSADGRLGKQHGHVDPGREAEGGLPAGCGTLSVAVSGGLGGHSGTDIARGRANAIKVLARALREARAGVPFRLVALDGGKSWNAIPRDAVAICSVTAEREAEFRAAVAAAADAVRDAHSRTDPE